MVRGHSRHSYRFPATNANSATLDLNFAGTAALPATVTFSRGTNATRTDSTGAVAWAPNNLLTYSEQFDNAAWALTTGTSVTPNSMIAPDGSLSADTITYDGSGTTAGYRIYNGIGTGVAEMPYTASIYLKANSPVTVILSGNVSAGGPVTCNLTTSWQRFNTSGVGNGIGSLQVLIYSNTANNTPFTIYAWGAQINIGTLQPYNQTTSAAYYGPRFDYDPITLVCKGLLIEEARTNLLTYSSNISNAAWTKAGAGTGSTPVITINAATAPDGTVTANLVAFNRGAGNTLSDSSAVTQNVTVLNVTAYTASVYVKAYAVGDVGKQIAIRHVGASGYKVVTLTSNWVTVTSTETSINTNATFEISIRGTITVDNLVNVLVWGAQLEAGAFATSYIPTTAAAATRNVDVAVMTGTNFSSWYNQTQGTMFAQYESFNPSTAVTDGVFSISDGTSTNRINLHTGVSGYQAYNFVTTGNVLQFSVVRTPFVAGAFVKFAGAYVNSSFAAYADGTQMGATSTSATMPTVNQLQIGGLENIGYPLNGHIARITYYPTRLPNATLQALTAVVTPPTTNFAVKSAAGTSYSTTRNVLSAAGTSYAVSATVLSANGTSYTPI